MQIEFGPAFEPLLEPGLEYLGAHGGRGSGKSHFFADALVARCIHQPSLFKRGLASEPGLHAVCIREIQKSLAQSAKRNVELKIRQQGVSHLFDIRKTEIGTPGNGLIIFQGMQNHTADTIKSLEGYDIAWVEEAQTLSATSLTMLRPTIRKKGSQLWFSWNPRKATDPVDTLLRGNELPPRAAVVQVNYDSNPWFEDGTRLNDERLFDLRRDPEMYQHVWLGEYESRSNAQVFRNWKTEWFDAPPPGTHLYAGADWGFIDPTVLIVCFIKGRELFIWREAWALRHPLDQVASLFDKVDPNWTPQNAVNPNWRSMARGLEIVADGADPQNINYMQRNGFPRMKAAIKGPGSIEAGISFLQSYDIVVHPDCEHVIKELNRYSYKVDHKQMDEHGAPIVTSELVDKENHTIDSIRYALEALRTKTSSGNLPSPW